MASLWLLLIALISFIIGSIPFAYLVAGKDILSKGSRNVGAMNVVRTVKSKTWGILLGILVILLDAAKAYAALFIASNCFFGNYNLQLGLMMAAIFVVFGHNHSLFLKFQGGGKGLSSLFGIMFFLNWIYAIFCLLILVTAVLAEKLILKMRGSERKGRLDGDAGTVSDVLGTPMVGRAIGIWACVLALAFLLPQESFLVIVPAICLSFSAHISRLKNYLQE